MDDVNDVCDGGDRPDAGDDGISVSRPVPPLPPEVVRDIETGRTPEEAVDHAVRIGLLSQADGWQRLRGLRRSA